MQGENNVEEVGKSLTVTSQFFQTDSILPDLVVRKSINVEQVGRETDRQV